MLKILEKLNRNVYRVIITGSSNVDAYSALRSHGCDPMTRSSGLLPSTELWLDIRDFYIGYICKLKGMQTVQVRNQFKPGQHLNKNTSNNQHLHRMTFA